MSFFDWFKAGPDAAKQVLEAGISGIDALVYTDEEKSAARQQLLTTWVDLQKSLGEETTVRSITRRLLAMMAMVSFTLLVLVAAGLYPWDQNYAKFLLELAESKFGWIVVTVVGFYFGPPMIARAISAAKE